MTIVPIHARADGNIRVEFRPVGARTEASRIHESGGLRLRFPNTPRGCEAVIVNTGGGVAGGDRASIDIVAREGADATITTQSAEKIYRAQADAAEIALSLRVEAGARLEWLPQETILFDGSRLSRRLDVDVDSAASLLLVESIVFGRSAMGETTIEGSFRDRWRVRRDRGLIFAEDARLEGAVTGILDRPAVGGGARASAILLHVAPDGEELVGPVRAALAGAPCEWGASAWNGMTVARLLSPSPEKLRAAMLTLLRALRGRDAPRVWQ